MAVKPITNKQSVNTSAVDRSEQRSFKNFKNSMNNKKIKKFNSPKIKQNTNSKMQICKLIE